MCEQSDRNRAHRALSRQRREREDELYRTLPPPSEEEVVACLNPTILGGDPWGRARKDARYKQVKEILVREFPSLY